LIFLFFFLAVILDLLFLFCSSFLRSAEALYNSAAGQSNAFSAELPRFARVTFVSAKVTTALQEQREQRS